MRPLVGMEKAPLWQTHLARQARMSVDSWPGMIATVPEDSPVQKFH